MKEWIDFGRMLFALVPRIGGRRASLGRGGSRARAPSSGVGAVGRCASSRALSVAKRIPFALVAVWVGGCSLRDLSYLQSGLAAGSGGGTGTSTGTGGEQDAGDGGDGGDGGDVDAGVDLAKGLYVYYKFDDGHGTLAADSSGNGHDAMLMGGVGWVKGKIGGAIYLNGQQQYVQLPTGIVQQLDAITIAFWIDWEGGSDSQRAFDFGSGISRFMAMSPNAQPDGTQFLLENNHVSNEYGVGTPLDMNVWVHVVVTLEPPNSKFYVNGLLVSSSMNMSIAPSSLQSTTQNWIGRSQSTSDPYLNAFLDDFRIYDRVLSPAEVVALANAN